MSAENLIERIRRQREVRLHTRGFKSVLVRAPAMAVEQELHRFYARPVRANASAFVNDLLAGCVEPTRRPCEFAALPEAERAQLCLALIGVCNLGASWRSLYGSHLTGDERLFAVMLWRHQAELAKFAELVRQLGRQRQQALGVQQVLGMPKALDMQKALGINKNILGMSGIARLFGANSPFNAASVIGKVAPFAAADPGKLYANELVRASKTLASLTSPNPLLGGWMYAQQPGWHIERVLSGVLGTESLQKTLSKLYPTRSLAGMLGFDPTRLDGLSLLTALQMPAFKIPDLNAYLEPFRETLKMAEEVDNFIARVDGRLMFLISNVGLGVVYRLRVLQGEEVEAALLTALEMVVLDGEFVAALRQAIAQAPHLNEQQRIDLDHALEHAGEGDYARAKSPLYHGLEGALWEAAIALPVVTPERRHLSNPNKEVRFETAVKALGLEQDYQTFLVRVMFGTAGNAYRHGSATPSGVRRQVLFGVAAITGWLDTFAGLPALDLLAARIATALPEAVERVQAGELAVTPQLAAARPRALLSAGREDGADE